MKFSYFVAAAIAFTASIPAQAADLLFTLTGSASARFILPNSLKPDPIDVIPGIAFYVNGVSGTVNGKDETLDLVFYNNPGDFGGFVLGYSLGFINTTGPQLYTGSEDAPIFLTGGGSYSLSEFGGPGAYSLTISAVPEPATWGMLVLGFGAMGATLRYRRRSADTMAHIA